MKSMVGSGHGWQGIPRSLKKRHFFFFKKENYTNERTCLLMKALLLRKQIHWNWKRREMKNRGNVSCVSLFQKNFSLHLNTCRVCLFETV